jgi:hypothetical protein
MWSIGRALVAPASTRSYCLSLFDQLAQSRRFNTTRRWPVDSFNTCQPELVEQRKERFFSPFPQ